MANGALAESPNRCVLPLATSMLRTFTRTHTRNLPLFPALTVTVHRSHQTRLPKGVTPEEKSGKDYTELVMKHAMISRACKQVRKVKIRLS